MPTGPRSRAASHTATVEIAGKPVNVAVRRNPRARRLYLRIDPVRADIILVLPRGVGLQEGLRFAHDRRGWLAGRLAAMPTHTPFVDGSAIPLLGRTVTIRHKPEGRGGVACVGDELHVAGRIEHLARRVRDWLKARARAELSARSHACAARIGRQIARVRIGDPKSRWGSCSAKGGLAYSWRLILAPPEVLDYVVAHEVAHLVEHNHGRRFWALVDSLTPATHQAKLWLRRHGNTLLRYG
ncbi:MAG TPA: SprT family zinc-dependent metalloprotease [Alphaproteobacteria bacterium]|nr:SprT family zinc-dependent metalloprotease [Alphaproteobacteria bacterium]